MNTQETTSKHSGFTSQQRFYLTLTVLLLTVVLYSGHLVLGGVNIATTINFSGTGSSLEKGLVGHYTFDGDDIDFSQVGEEIRDRSSQQHHLDATVFDQGNTAAGVIGQAGQFNGTTDYVTSAEQFADLFSVSSKSISVWIRPQGTSVTRSNVWQLSGVIGDQSGYIGIHRGILSGEDRIWVYNWDGNADTVSTPYTIGEWTHITMLHQGGTLYLYKDGILVGSTASGDTTTLNNIFYIGAAGAGETAFDGLIDDVRLYDRALTEDEIIQLYRQGATTKIAKTPELTGSGTTLDDDLVLHYTFDGSHLQWQTASSEVRDSSGQDNHGAIMEGLDQNASVSGALGQALSFQLSDSSEGSTYTREQSASGSGSATFGSTPSEGNLLVAMSFHRSNGSSASISGSGWTQRVLRTTELSDSSARRGLVVWTKVAGSSEPTSVTVTWSPSVTNQVIIQEFSATGDGSWTFESKADNDNGTTNNASSLNSGSTASLSSSPQLLIGAVGIRGAESAGTVSSIAFNNSFGNIVTRDSGGTFRAYLSSAYRNDDSGGTKDVTASWTHSQSGNTGETATILAFSYGAGAASSSGAYIDAGSVGTIHSVSFWLKTASSTQSIMELNGSASVALSGGSVSTTGFTSPTVYVNGVQTDSVELNTWQYVTVTTATGINASAVKIGRVGTNEYFDGALDDMRFYGRVLSADEIKQLYRQGATTKIATTQELYNSTLNNGLVGHWTFDGYDIQWENATAQIRDRSSEANHLTTSGIGQNNASRGKIGQALQFADSQFLTAGTILPTSSYTKALWVKVFNTGNTNNNLISGGDNTSHAFWIPGCKAYKISSGHDGSSCADGNWDDVQDPDAIEFDRWYHVAVTYDSSVDGGTKRLYTNGVEIDSATSVAAPSSALTYVGTFGNSGGVALNGLMDDVRIYNRALTAAEVEELFEYGNR